MNIGKWIAKHLTKPEGLFGSVVGFFMNRQNRALYAEVIRYIDPTDGDTILDIGCGNGYVLGLIAKQCDASLTGIDISESILNAAKRRNQKYITNNTMHFYCQDLKAMDFPDAAYSKIYTINTVYFWESLDEVMTEIHRILKPNGLFVNTLFSNEFLDTLSFTKHGYQKFSSAQLHNAGTNAGFTVEIIPILNGRAFCYLYRKPDM